MFKKQLALFGAIVLLFPALKANLDSLHTSLKFHQNNNGQAEVNKTLLAIGNYYFDENQDEKAIEYYEMALSGQIDDEVTKSKLVMNVAHSYQNIADYTNALEYYLEALDIYEVLDVDSSKAEALDWISIMYLYLGVYENSLEYQLKAIGLREEINDSIGLAYSYYSLGAIYDQQRNDKESIKYFKKTLELANKFDKKNLSYNCLASLGNTYETIDSLDLSYSYTAKSLELAKSLDYDYGMAYSLNSLGYYFIKRKQYDSAFYYFNESNIITDKIGEKEEKCFNHIGLGTICKETEDYAKAVEHYLLALEIAREVKAPGD